jgi:hypothetical protein
MPTFGHLISRGRQNVHRFFNSTLPGAARSGVRFFNTTLVPAARQAHKVHKAIANEVTTNASVPDKIRQGVHKTSAFADLGLSRLEDVQGGVNRVASNLGFRFA